jgi:hypothetical protein
LTNIFYNNKLNIKGVIVKNLFIGVVIIFVGIFALDWNLYVGIAVIGAGAFILHIAKNKHLSDTINKVMKRHE